MKIESRKSIYLVEFGTVDSKGYTRSGNQALECVYVVAKDYNDAERMALEYAEEELSSKVAQIGVVNTAGDLNPFAVTHYDEPKVCAIKAMANTFLY